MKNPDSKSMDQYLEELSWGLSDLPISIRTQALSSIRAEIEALPQGLASAELPSIYVQKWRAQAGLPFGSHPIPQEGRQWWKWLVFLLVVPVVLALTIAGFFLFNFGLTVFGVLSDNFPKWEFMWSSQSSGDADSRHRGVGVGGGLGGQNPWPFSGSVELDSTSIKKLRVKVLDGASDSDEPASSLRFNTHEFNRIDWSCTLTSESSEPTTSESGDTLTIDLSGAKIVNCEFHSPSSVEVER
jgi:hypothetical protein